MYKDRYSIVHLFLVLFVFKGFLRLENPNSLIRNMNVFLTEYLLAVAQTSNILIFNTYI